MTFLKTAVAVAAMAFTAVTMAATEGTDYVKLDKPYAYGEGKLTKIFSYDCPFCYKYDVGVDPKVLPRIEKETGLKFNLVHLETKGKYGPRRVRILCHVHAQGPGRGRLHRIEGLAL